MFILKGHTKIAIITGEDKEFSAAERLKGYRRALDDYDIPVCDHLIFRDSYDLEGGYKSFKKLVENKGCTAVLISNYYMAVGAVIAVNEENINIPGDISIICFDDLELSKVFKPKLTSVSQSTAEIGNEAVKLLLSRIDGSNSGCRIVRVPAKIIVNNSIKKMY